MRGVSLLVLTVVCVTLAGRHVPAQVHHGMLRGPVVGDQGQPAELAADGDVLGKGAPHGHDDVTRPDWGADLVDVDGQLGHVPHFERRRVPVDNVALLQ